jgi:hypothetical protein
MPRECSVRARIVRDPLAGGSAHSGAATHARRMRAPRSRYQLEEMNPASRQIAEAPSTTLCPPTPSTNGHGPHQFRTRNDSAKMQRTRSNSNENNANSTKRVDIPPLITVWLQVRALPGPPMKSVTYEVLFRRSGITAPDTCAFRSPIGSRIAIFSTASDK